MSNGMYSFIGGSTGPWKIVSINSVTGKAMEPIDRLEIVNEFITSSKAETKWVLHGTTSNLRYTTRQEKEQLDAKSPPLGREGDTCAALIPIKKSKAWWELAQDERRTIFEAQSEHIKIGLKYLPAIARRLHHSHDLVGEPFDFLTWFEYSPTHSDEFEELVSILRKSPEWKYVDREVDIRLVLDKPSIDPNQPIKVNIKSL
ncbi:chlorite dismutase family protein [Paenibacillus tarimensis]